MTTASRLAALGLGVGMITVAPAFAGATKWCGGSGGDKRLTLSCASGELIGGVGGTGASFLDDLRIACATPDPHGLFHPSGDWKSGPRHIVAEGSGLCDGGRALTGLSTRAGIYVDRVSHGACGPCVDGACHRQVGVEFTVNAGGGNDNAGHECDLNCPDGQGAYSIEIRYGAWIDAIRLHCRKP
jgi:hypothetical protein